MKNRLFGLVCLSTAMIILAVGCIPDEANEKPVVDAASGTAAHQGHAHGPRGGEMFSMPEAGLAGEWVARYGDNLVTVYVYEQDGKTPKKINAEKLVASRKVKDLELYELTAVDAEGGMADKFELVDETFAIAMKTTGANLEVEIDGVKYSTKLDKDPHAH